MSDSVEQTCPACGGAVRVVGKTTLHYERVADTAEIERLQEENDRLRPIVDHFLRGGYLHPDQIGALLRAKKTQEPPDAD